MKRPSALLLVVAVLIVAVPAALFMRESAIARRCELGGGRVDWTTGACVPAGTVEHVPFSTRHNVLLLACGVGLGLVGIAAAAVAGRR